MDLFKPIFPDNKLHPNYKNILKQKDVWKMDVLQSWANGFLDRDGKFLQEFQLSFNSSFWELYLYATLKEYQNLKGEKFEVSFDYYAPDFYLPNLNIGIEATIALEEINGIPEYILPDINAMGNINEFNRKTIVRLLNSIISKYNKYIGSYSKLEHMKNSSFIIALQNFSSPFSYCAINRPVEAVLYNYYVDEEEFIRGDTYNLNGKFIHSVKKNDNVDLELGLFNSEKYSDISAIIYNPCATIGKVTALSKNPYNNSLFTALKYNPNSNTPHFIRKDKNNYSEHLLDGLIIYHNPFAKRKIDFELFRHPKVTQVFGCNNGILSREKRENFLEHRCVFTLDVASKY